MAHFGPKERRARRRARSLSISIRRRDEHVARIHTDRSTGEVRVACVCELADWYFEKRASFGCGCRKRRKGRPKVAAGMCTIGDRDRIHRWRKEARDLQIAVAVGRGLQDSDRHWPAAKADPKVFTVERRDLDRKGEPRGDWFVYRRYRTVAARDNAVAALTKNSGPRAEFRAGPILDGR